MTSGTLLALVPPETSVTIGGRAFTVVQEGSGSVLMRAGGSLAGRAIAGGVAGVAMDLLFPAGIVSQEREMAGIAGIIADRAARLGYDDIRVSRPGGEGIFVSVLTRDGWRVIADTGTTLGDGTVIPPRWPFGENLDGLPPPPSRQGSGSSPAPSAPSAPAPGPSRPLVPSSPPASAPPEPAFDPIGFASRNPVTAAGATGTAFADRAAGISAAQSLNRQYPNLITLPVELTRHPQGEEPFRSTTLFTVTPQKVDDLFEDLARQGLVADADAARDQALRDSGVPARYRNRDQAGGTGQPASTEPAAPAGSDVLTRLRADPRYEDYDFRAGPSGIIAYPRNGQGPILSFDPEGRPIGDTPPASTAAPQRPAQTAPVEGAAPGGTVPFEVTVPPAIREAIEKAEEAMRRINERRSRPFPGDPDEIAGEELANLRREDRFAALVLEGMLFKNQLPAGGSSPTASSGGSGAVPPGRTTVSPGDATPEEVPNVPIEALGRWAGNLRPEDIAGMDPAKLAAVVARLRDALAIDGTTATPAPGVSSNAATFALGALQHIARSIANTAPPASQVPTSGPPSSSISVQGLADLTRTDAYADTPVLDRYGMGIGRPEDSTLFDAIHTQRMLTDSGTQYPIYDPAGQSDGPADTAYTDALLHDLHVVLFGRSTSEWDERSLSATATLSNLDADLSDPAVVLGDMQVAFGGFGITDTNTLNRVSELISEGTPWSEARQELLELGLISTDRDESTVSSLYNAALAAGTPEATGDAIRGLGQMILERTRQVSTPQAMYDDFLALAAGMRATGVQSGLQALRAQAEAGQLSGQELAQGIRDLLAQTRLPSVAERNAIVEQIRQEVPFSTFAQIYDRTVLPNLRRWEDQVTQAMGAAGGAPEPADGPAAAPAAPDATPAPAGPVVVDAQGVSYTDTALTYLDGSGRSVTVDAELSPRQRATIDIARDAGMNLEIDVQRDPQSGSVTGVVIRMTD